MIDYCISAFIYGSENAFSLMMKCSFSFPPPREGWRWWHDLLITLRNYHRSLNWLWQWQRPTGRTTWYSNLVSDSRGMWKGVNICRVHLCRKFRDRSRWALHLKSLCRLLHENASYTAFRCACLPARVKFSSIQICSPVKLKCVGWNFPCRSYASGWVC